MPPYPHRDARPPDQSNSIENCIVCPYDRGHPCEVPYLRGTLTGVSESPSPGASGGWITLQIEGGAQETIQLQDPQWLRLLPQVRRALRLVQTGGNSARLEVSAYHLSRLPGSQAARPLTTGANGQVILEPDWLINVTELTKLEYCPRQYLVDRYRLAQTNAPMLRGNIVHRTFEQMLKTPQDEAAITLALKNAFFEQARGMAALNQTKAALWVLVKDHYVRLKAWARLNHRPGKPRSESFLLSPQLGMKGKIDALWFRDGSVSLIAELKTGRSMGPRPKPGHAFQAGAYSLMSAARGWKPQEGTETVVLYSGNQPLGASPNVERAIPMSAESLRQVIFQRNQLVLSDYLSDAPYETLQPNKCISCTIGEACAAIGHLLGHIDPRPVSAKWTFNPEASLDGVEKAWFQAYSRLLFQEYRAVKTDHAALWQVSSQERAVLGRAFLADSSHLASRESKRFTYLLEGDNQSELREEDFVLVSDARGPMGGMLAQGIVRRPLEDGMEVEFSEELEFEPHIVDSYVSENLVERQFAGLYAWLDQERSYRDLVVRSRPPAFSAGAPQPHFPSLLGPRQLNARQQEVVRKGLSMEDSLLVLGPPGSGKTTLIVAVVRELLHQGQRLLLAAGTNTALDNLLRPLVEAGFGDQVLRLGVRSRTDPGLRAYVPEALAESDDLDTYVQSMRRVMLERRVVGATATTWLSNTWEIFDRFDVAIVDEAAQITLPAALGALRLAKRFILIGDHRQLPPVVISEPRNGNALAEPALRLSGSLFEELYRSYRHTCPEAIVHLNEQYRMNEEICVISRNMWYDEDLQPATPGVAGARLALTRQLDRRLSLHPALDPDIPAVFLHIPWSEAWSSPRASLREAQAAGHILRAYLDAGLSLDCAGIIAPFRAQVALIRRTLEAMLPGQAAEIRGAVDTVDRFQGQERDLILMSLATHGNFVHDLLQDERRLNVAITRARHKLILLGDRDVLCQHPMFADLLRHCAVFGEELLPVFEP